MGLLKTGASALGKLLMVGLLAAAFVLGMVGVVWMSLRGEEIQVPEIVGKDFNQSEKELAALGLKIKRRSYRYSEEKPNTVIEQAPKAGDTVKTGHQILVVVSQENPEGTEAPAPLKKDETLDSNTDKPKTTNKNSNAKKPEKTRDVITNKANKNANTGNSNNNSSNSNSKSNSNGTDNKNSSTPAANKTPAPAKTPAAKPNNDKPPSAGDTRSRRTP
jgi:beta-lactam-binding protein with PASTA domain